MLLVVISTQNEVSVPVQVFLLVWNLVFFLCCFPVSLLNKCFFDALVPFSWEHLYHCFQMSLLFFFFYFFYGHLTHINSFYVLNFRVSLLHHVFFKTQPFICLFFSTCFRKRSIQRTKPEQKCWVEFNTNVSPAPTPSSSSDASQDQRSRSGPQVGYIAMLIQEESFVRCCWRQGYL